MTDNAERKVRQWATKRNGDPLTPEDVVELVFAFADDQEADHRESLVAIDKNRRMLEEHFIEADVRDERIEVLEKWRHDASEKCLDRVTAIVDEAWEDKHAPKHEEHLRQFHGSPRRSDDGNGEEHFADRDRFPQGDQRTMFEMMLGWSVVKWLAALIVGALLVAGISYWTSSCAAQRVEKDVIEQGGEVHMAVPSPSP